MSRYYRTQVGRIAHYAALAVVLTVLALVAAGVALFGWQTYGGGPW